MSAEVDVRIRQLAYGGAGVGEVIQQHDGTDDLRGISAFVPFSVPGEEVRARISQRKKRHLETILLEVQQESCARVPARCRYFTDCGGCSLQHIDYEEQRSLKQQMVIGQLRASGIGIDAIEAVEDVVPSEPYRYRRRVSLHVDARGTIGFYRANSRSVVPIEHCDIADDAINSVLINLRPFGSLVSGRVSSVTLDADSEHVVGALGAPYELGEREVRDILKHAKEFFSDVTLRAAGKEVGSFGSTTLRLPLDSRGTMLEVPAGTFSQVNERINLELVSEVRREAAVRNRSRVLDLYSGAGNFALPLARDGALVDAVETNEQSVSWGRRSAARLKMHDHISFHAQSTEKFLKNARKAQYDVIVADPPRLGLGEMVRRLPQSPKLLFVSCHLPSFARDAKALSDAGWKVDRVVPFDMFAQTSYLEILGVFVKE